MMCYSFSVESEFSIITHQPSSSEWQAQPQCVRTCSGGQLLMESPLLACLSSHQVSMQVANLACSCGP